MRTIVAAALFASVLAVRPASASTFFEETLEGLEQRLIAVPRPGLPIPANAPRVVDRREILPAEPGERERRFHLFRDLQVRRSGAASHLVGSGSPVDYVSGVLPGTLLAMRVGGEGGGLGVYGILGAGTFTTYRHAIPQRDADPLQVETASTPFAFLGFGAEVRLYRALMLAGEMSWGSVIARSDGQRVVLPVPGDTVRTAALALRVVY